MNRDANFIFEAYKKKLKISESSDKQLTSNDVHRIVEHLFATASEVSRHFPNVKYLYSGQIYDVLRDMGYDYFNSDTQNAVRAYEDHCMQASETFGHDYNDEEKVTLTHAQDPETNILWYSWSGDSYQNQAATESAVRLADKHDFDKVVIDAQG